MTKLVCLLLAPAFGAGAQVVEGNVINSATGTGIAGVSMTLEQVTTGAYRVYAAKTDAQGHFHLDNVQDGIYTTRFASPDYWWAGEFDELPRIAVAAGAGKPVTLEGRMMPLPHITGRVVDGRGNAVAKAQVIIAGSGMMALGETDATGKFDLRQRPGAYTLAAAAPRDWKPPDPDPESGEALGWAVTYYPGAAHAEAAAQMTVRPGVDISDLELKLVAVPVHAVGGVVLAPDGKPVPKALVTLGGNPPFLLPAETDSKADGTFEFRSVADGEWRMTAAAEVSGVHLVCFRAIAVDGHDTEDLKLRMDAPFAIHGKVVMEAAPGVAVPKRPTVMLRLLLTDRESDITPFLTARPDADGNFTLPRVYPGQYRIDASEPAPPYYLSSVRLGETDLPAMQMELSSGAAPITLTYKSDGGTVRGTAEKCASGRVLLLPQDAALRHAGIVGVTRCDPNGRYEINAMRPGEYYALAFAGSASAPYPDDTLLNQGARVTVRAGEATSADLKAIVRGVY